MVPMTWNVWAFFFVTRAILQNMSTVSGASQCLPTGAESTLNTFPCVMFFKIVIIR
jgi:hypothetical protein